MAHNIPRHGDEFVWGYADPAGAWGEMTETVADVIGPEAWRVERMDRRDFLAAAFGWVVGTVGALVGVRLIQPARSATAELSLLDECAPRRYDTLFYRGGEPMAPVKWSGLDYNWEQYQEHVNWLDGGRGP